MPAGKNENIRCLKHHEIDLQKWDTLVETSADYRVYACSWYLNIVAGKWNALVWGDYEYVMPVPCRNKWGISYIYQPFFTQQLGIYPSPPGSIQKVFAKRLKKTFCHISYQTGIPLLPEEFQDFNFSRRRNRSLLLNTDYDTLSLKFSENTLRNTRKAGQNRITVIRDTDAGKYVMLKKKYGKVDVEEDSYRILEKLMKYTVEKGNGRICLAIAPDGEITAGTYFLFHRNRAYYLNAFSSEAGMATASAFAIVDGFCREFAGSGLILDFEGSEIEGIDRFYRGFGATEDFYYLLTFSRIPSLLLHLKEILHL